MTPDLLQTLHNLIKDIQRERQAEREASDRKLVKANELAAAICPFTKGERIVIPRPHRCLGIAEGLIISVNFDLDYGYWLHIEDHDEKGLYKNSCCASGRLNPEIEDANGKTPVLMPDDLAALFKPLRGRGGYFI